jgi:flagellar protein FlaG
VEEFNGMSITERQNTMDAIIATKIAGAPSHESSRPSPRPRNVSGGFSGDTAPAPQARAENSAAVQPAEHEAVQQLAAELESALNQNQGDISVSVDQESGMVIVRITDEVTGEIVKQVPAEELLKVDQSMEKIVGLLIDDLA